jgi:DNA-binding YbaB/EbfC family protein
MGGTCVKRFGGGFNMQKMMKQIEKAQSDLKRVQEEVSARTVEAQAGGGMVKVVVNGKIEVLSIQINPEAVDPEDVDMLQDLVLAAINEGIRKAQDMMNDEMSKLKIPGIM